MIAVAIALALAAAPSTTPPRLPPVEMCRGDAGFDVFRKELAAAVAAKDVAAIKRLSASDIRSSFGGDGGWAEFSSSWGLDTEPAKSKLWPQLDELFKLGCAPTQAGGRVFPSLFQASGEDTDPFELVVARPGSKLYRAPRAAEPVATLDWHSARQGDPGAESGWVQVTLFDGRKGWLREADVLSPLDYRLVAERRGGRWVIAALVAGD